jgi:hypothetical protein
MSAAEATDTGRVLGVSPELVLVDSILARRLRALLPDPPDALARRAQRADAPTLPNVSLRPDLTVRLPDSLAAEDSASAAAPDTEQAPLEEQTSARPSLFPFSFPDDGRFLGVREAGAQTSQAERVLDPKGGFGPTREHLRRVTTLIPTSSAAAAVALFVVQLYLGHGALA